MPSSSELASCKPSAPLFASSRVQGMADTSILTRACIAASVRLATTVTFAHELDQMYYIGPLLFWACAEMTCGFFILSVPCLPKIISESGLPRGFKRLLGLTLKASTDPLDSKTNPDTGLSSTHKKRLSRSGLAANDRKYLRMVEDEVPMAVMGTSESQEHLQEEGRHRNTLDNGNNAVVVTRTTQVTYTSDDHSADGRPHGGLVAPWSR